MYQNASEQIPVRLIFQKYVYEGYGAQRLCNYLCEHNIMGRDGKNIPNVSIVRMIKNKSYTGYLINGKVETECPQLRIIEPELFEQAQEMRQARKKFTKHEPGTAAITKSGILASVMDSPAMESPSWTESSKALSV